MVKEEASGTKNESSKVIQKVLIAGAIGSIITSLCSRYFANFWELTDKAAPGYVAFTESVLLFIGGLFLGGLICYTFLQRIKPPLAWVYVTFFAVLIMFANFAILLTGEDNTIVWVLFILSTIVFVGALVYNVLTAILVEKEKFKTLDQSDKYTLVISVVTFVVGLFLGMV